MTNVSHHVMGANYSSDNGRSHADREDLGTKPKTCYYELLGIEIKASEDDIKKAYRKKALELHPDRNYGNVEAVTERFADVQAAYEVLSDPQERAWYDAHRENILLGGDNGEENFVDNIRVTTAEEILRFLPKIDFRLASTSSAGLFLKIDDFFEGLAKEEEVASRWGDLQPIQYPPFGQPNDSHEDVVRPFYAIWNGFATAKSFSWKDIYRYSEAPDRRVRRMMEKENKRLRDDGIREFNDSVRSLVAFIRKRDPRYKPNKQSEADRQKVLRDAAVAQAARSRAANQAKLADEAVPEWMNPTPKETALISDDEQNESGLVKHEVECLVCNKIFKSEKQYEAHERSKKHIKAAQQLRRQMLRENQALEQHATEKTHNLSNKLPCEFGELGLDKEHSSHDHIDLECEQTNRSEPEIISKDGETITQMSSEGRLAPGPLESEDVSEGSFDSRNGREQGLSDEDEDAKDENPLDEEFDKTPDGELLAKPVDASVVDDIETAKKPRVGKAKEKRARKAAQRTTLTNDLDDRFSCATCQERFPSKTQLFKHLKFAAHAHSIENRTQKG